ncbi:hypothetical protein QA640_31900 [Bradyrhizobium sp. CB82]|uniref:hypothetical protein n=1 Tax=Bradyrhizobium sp. CB82 TaxID=3039159 RepID=UPI0024B21F66|nr:hypothetical protein [Bradyrhizobium sp. CB82]WFU38969.1 hypothetical protein QA640_31900 [Bradyrhizobium sp. CB82]
MKKTQLAFAMILAAGLAVAPFAAEAKTHKKHHSSATSSQTTTGANMKSSGGGAANPSSQGNVGPGTNQAGSMPSK